MAESAPVTVTVPAEEETSALFGDDAQGGGVGEAVGEFALEGEGVGGGGCDGCFFLKSVRRAVKVKACPGGWRRGGRR